MPRWTFLVFPCVLALGPWQSLARVHADAPSDRYSLVGGIVTDSATKLNWQHQAPEQAMIWTEAAAYCTALDLGGMGWRLPTLKELHTLVDETRALPAIDRTFFPETATAFFWSSSPLSNFAVYAWGVSFAYGHDTWFDMKQPQNVRCVR